ncbi:hypothetical protein PG994_010569 [Apiospora phragmitis]|uniref:Uncharacterized protein n=1 Tax=Apiospora phragmitis TaxID=2905665 RepID=A0ABR1TQB0_9PEZI
MAATLCYNAWQMPTLFRASGMLDMVYGQYVFRSDVANATWTGDGTTRSRSGCTCCDKANATSRRRHARTRRRGSAAGVSAPGHSTYYADESMIRSRL